MNRAAIALSIALLLPAAAVAGERSLLWRVVQTCVATHNLLGAPFPCLDLHIKQGAEAGYAVVRTPLENVHIVVTPTVPTIGIEAQRLIAPSSPNYFADAWSARHFVVDSLPRPPGRDDLALAVNSRLGRSQDQLHIHVDCIRQSVKNALASQLDRLHIGIWTRISVLPRAPRYSATILDARDFDKTNIFRLVRDSLAVDPDDMDDVTIVVVGTELPSGPGFVVLARRRILDGRDEAHGEALMDHACSAFRASPERG